MIRLPDNRGNAECGSIVSGTTSATVRIDSVDEVLNLVDLSLREAGKGG